MKGELAKGEARAIHYDGVGDRYTIMRRDGSEKAFRMDRPPVTEIRIS